MLCVCVYIHRQFKGGKILILPIQKTWVFKILVQNLFFFFFFFFLRFLFIYLFIFNLWLCWVFDSVRGLPPAVASGGHSSSLCAGLSCCGAQAPDAQAQ